MAGVEYWEKYKDKLNIIANYNLNVFNNYTIEELRKLGIKRIVLSPELNEKELIDISRRSSIETELIAFGRIPLMSIGYCLFGKSNKCYPHCEMKCKSGSSFYLKDRKGFEFKIVPDNMQTITTLYNSKITSIDYGKIEAEYIDVLISDENIDTINNIICKVRKNETFIGTDYTSGNLNKMV